MQDDFVDATTFYYYYYYYYYLAFPGMRKAGI